MQTRVARTCVTPPVRLGPADNRGDGAYHGQAGPSPRGAPTAFPIVILNTEKPRTHVVCNGPESFVRNTLAISTGHVIPRVPHDVVNGDLVLGLAADGFERVA